MNKGSQLTEWVINKIRTEYQDDVALLIGVKGHNVNQDGHGECFDYFIPATERGNALAQTFIIGGIGYDLYPRTWERMEKTANLEDPAVQCIGNAVILYSRSKEDEAHFLSIQKQFYDNLGDQVFVYQKALEYLDVAMDLYRTMMFETKISQVRMAVGFIHYYLSLSVVYLNHTYFKEIGNGRIPELKNLACLPENFIEYYQAILDAKTIDELKSLAHLLISTTRQFIAAYTVQTVPPNPDKNFLDLAGWYQELSLAWRRIRYYCAEQNSDAAFAEACALQNELNIIKEEFNLKEMDLLGCFDTSNLNLLSEKSTELENYIISEIQNHEITIRQYDTLEAFLTQA